MRVDRRNTVVCCLLSSLMAPPLMAAEFSEEVNTRRNLVQVSLGRQSADLIIRGATMLNVVTAEWLPNQDIVIAGERIAWVGDAGKWPGTAAEIVDASGLYAVPGFGESHKHIESTFLPPEYEAALVVPHGNTWTIEGSHEISNVVGNHNVDFWLQAEDAGSPLKIFPDIGSATPPTVYEFGGGNYGYDEMAAFLDQDLRVTGLDEVMDWPALSNIGAPGHDRLWGMMQATWERRAVVEGHGSGLVDTDTINAFAAAGLSSDHESRLPEEALDKVRHGVFMEIRVDTARVVFPYFLEKGLKDWSNLSVTTDDRDVLVTSQLGSMDYNIRSALEAGVPTEIAYQLGGYNTARHFNIDHLVGSISPGRYADIVLLTDPQTVAIDRVYANGKLAAQNGEYLLDIPQISYESWATDTVNIGRALTAEDFVIPAAPGRDSMNVAYLEPFYFEPELRSLELPVTDGVLKADPANGIIKAAMVDRYHGTAATSKMFWKGVGPVTPNSALASSQSHDLHNIWSIGNDDAAMALAVNTVAAMKGGWALVSEGKVVAQVRLEIAGLMTQRPWQQVAEEMEALLSAADAMQWIGNPGLPERMRFAFLTASPWHWQLVAPYEGNPGGLVDVTTGETHAVAW